MSEQLSRLSASLLRMILIVSMLAIVAVGVGGFVFGRGVLRDYAIDVSKKNVDADASNGNLDALSHTKQELAANQDVIAKINALRSTSRFPEFQIVDDVKNYAEKNGLSVTTFDYIDPTSATPATGQTTTPTAAQPVTQSNTIALSVTLKSPVNYKALLQFIYDVEQSLPKMQLQGLSISKADNPNQVEVDPIIIEMYKD